MILAGNVNQVSNKKIRKLVVCLRQEIHYRDAMIQSYQQCDDFLENRKSKKEEKTERENAIEQWLQISDAPKSLHQKVKDDFNRWEWSTEKILSDCQRMIKEKKKNEETTCNRDYVYLR